MTTLYDDLGVPIDADRAALTRAHRKAVKCHHPDAGGDRDQFERVQRAWLVLSDPTKRERYDRTGKAEDEPQNDLSRLAGIIVGAFDQVMGEAAEIMDRVDMIARMTGRLRTAITEARQKIAQGNRVRRQIENARKRLSFTGEGPDLIGSALDDRLQQAGEQITAMEAEVAMVERAIDHLKLYGWDFERATAPLYETVVFGPTSTSIIRDAAWRMGL